jgi:hypothetical protein
LCRPPGFKSKTLIGVPGSEDFMADYHDWLAKAGVTLTQRFTDIGAKRAKAGSVDAILAKYKASDAFTKGLAVATQNQRRPILENFADKRGPSGQRFGEKRIDTLQRRHILAILEGMSRDMKRNWIKALRGLMVFAVAEQIRSDDPTQGIKLERSTKSIGHMTWLEPQVDNIASAIHSAPRLGSHWNCC